MEVYSLIRSTANAGRFFAPPRLQEDHGELLTSAVQRWRH